MYTTRIKYAMDNFIVENYFLPMEGSYELKENSESGKSLLVLSIEGVNICVEEYDNKKRCEFVKVSGKQGMKKCVDHFVLKNNGSEWDLHMIEMKSNVGDKRWVDIKAKMRASYLNIRAICAFLDIKLNDVYTYTTYEKECFNNPENTADPKAMLPLLGEKATNFKQDEWDKDIINIKIDKTVTWSHKAIKMERDEGNVLQGSLNIQS